MGQKNGRASNLGEEGHPATPARPISATPTPTCSAPSAPGRARAPLSCSPSPTPALCRCISTRSAATPCRYQGPWRRPDGPRRLPQHRHSSSVHEKPHHHPAALALPPKSFAAPVENHLAVAPPPELALEPRLRRLPLAIIEAGMPSSWNKLIDQPAERGPFHRY